MAKNYSNTSKNSQNGFYSSKEENQSKNRNSTSNSGSNKNSSKNANKNADKNSAKSAMSYGGNKNCGKIRDAFDESDKY